MSFYLHFFDYEEADDFPMFINFVFPFVKWLICSFKT